MPKGNKSGSSSKGQEVSYEQSNITFLSSYKRLIFAALALLLSVYSYVIYSEMHKKGVIDLTNASSDALKEALFSSDDQPPSIFQCAKRETPKATTNKADTTKQNKNSSDLFTVSPIFEEFFKAQGSKYKFAKLNCYQILPSGKNIYDRFGLDKKAFPVIFGHAPWLAKPVQAKGTNLNTAISLATFFDKEIATPRATSISDDSFLHSYCKFSLKKPTTVDINNTKTAVDESVTKDKDDKTNTTCIVLLKGTLHSSSHTDVEERLIRKYPKQRFTVIDASKYRLSFERPQDSPATSFGYKLIMLRNGTHFKSMVGQPFTLENADEFIASSMALSLSDFYLDTSQTSTNRIKMIKANSPFFKRSDKGNDDDDDSDNDDSSSSSSSTDNSDNSDSDSSAKKNKPSQRKSKSSSTKSSSSDKGPSKKTEKSSKAPETSKAKEKEKEKEPVVLSDEELAAARQRERERTARERMFDDRDDIQFDVDDEPSEDLAGEGLVGGGGGGDLSSTDYEPDEDHIEL